MKIIIFDGSFKTTTFINNLISGLSKNNEVYVLGFNEELSAPIPGVSYVPLGSNNSKFKFIKTSLMYSFSGGYLFSALKNIFSKNRKTLQDLNLKYQINRIKPDIIHLQWLSNINWFENFLKHSSIKFVISFRGYHINVRPYVNSKNKAYLQKWLPYFDGIHGVSKAILTNLHKLQIELKNQKVKAIYSGHDILNLAKTKTSWQLKSIPVFLLVGRNHWIKNYNLILLVAKKLKESNIPVKFKFVGFDINDPEEILFISKTLHLDNYVDFIPNQSSEKLIDFYVKADALILPSIEEGIANVCIEAMCYRLPIIASDVGSMGELIESNKSGILVENINVNAFYEAIQKFLKMKESERKLMVNNGYEKVKIKFNSELMIKEFNGFYKNILNA